MMSPNLAWVEAEFRHGGMASNDPLRQWLFEVFDWIAQMEGVEGGVQF